MQHGLCAILVSPNMFADRLLHVGLYAPPMSAAQIARLAFLALSRVRQFLCAIRGHDLRLHFERRRLSLQCSMCGWDSPGWTIDRSAPQPHANGDRHPSRSVHAEVEPLRVGSP
jgi:hypothetical protein